MEGFHITLKAVRLSLRVSPRSSTRQPSMAVKCNLKSVVVCAVKPACRGPQVIQREGRRRAGHPLIACIDTDGLERSQMGALGHLFQKLWFGDVLSTMYFFVSSEGVLLKAYDQRTMVLI
jgi:hypothetical protein